MTGLYAQNTSVSTDKSRFEIERNLSKYGATEFGYMNGADRSVIVFKIANRVVRITLPLPNKSDKQFQPKRLRYGLSKDERVTIAWEQACRSSWRALSLVIKAKLEAVATGISTVEREFLSDVVLPGGKTIGEWVQPQLVNMKDAPKLLPMG